MFTFYFPPPPFTGSFGMSLDSDFLPWWRDTPLYCESVFLVRYHGWSVTAIAGVAEERPSLERRLLPGIMKRFSLQERPKLNPYAAIEGYPSSPHPSPFCFFSFPNRSLQSHLMRGEEVIVYLHLFSPTLYLIIIYIYICVCDKNVSELSFTTNLNQPHT